MAPAEAPDNFSLIWPNLPTSLSINKLGILSIKLVSNTWRIPESNNPYKSFCINRNQ